METKHNVGDTVFFEAKIDKIVIQEIGGGVVPLYYLEGIGDIGFQGSDLRVVRTKKQCDIGVETKTEGVEEVADLAAQISAKQQELDALIRKLASTKINVEFKCRV